MAGFHTHITMSSLVGVGYAYVGASTLDLPLSTCLLGGGLCAISGMMPDLDSDRAVPARETLSFLAAVAPMLLFYRFEYEGLPTEHILLFGAPLYLLIRFGFGELMKVTVHRGMFHSIPAAFIAGLIAYVICDTGISRGREFKGFGAVIGYLVHLILDEIWAVEVRGGRVRFKKSFGTALKLFGNVGSANSATWGLLVGLSVFAANDQGQPAIVAPFQYVSPKQLVPTEVPLHTTRVIKNTRSPRDSFIFRRPSQSDREKSLRRDIGF